MIVTRRSTFFIFAGLAVVASGGAVAEVPRAPENRALIFTIPRGTVVAGCERPSGDPAAGVCPRHLVDAMASPRLLLISTGSRLVLVESPAGQEVLEEILKIPAEHAGKSRW